MAVKTLVYDEKKVSMSEYRQALALNYGADLDEETVTAIQDAIRKSALQCYVVEGVYPPDLQYLEDNYGLQVNTRDFYVTYEAFASNLPPTVRVTARMPS